MVQHDLVEIDHQPAPRAVPALTRSTAAGASAPRGTQVPQRPLPARPDGRLDRGPQPSTGQLQHQPAGAAIDHARPPAGACPCDRAP
jgi:hypothetical protein